MEEMQKIEKNEKLKFLDFVRAAATIAVFMFHGGGLLSLPQHSIVNWQKFITDGGTVGVCVFFVLSGFLLFYQLYKNNAPLDKAGLKEYIRKRLLRILPLYYFSLLFIVLFLRHDMLFSAEGWRSIVYNLLFLRGIKNAAGGGGTISINPVYWSLVVEIHFYIILPIFYTLFFKFQRKIYFFLLIFLGLLYRIILVYYIKTPSMQLLRFTPANFDFFAFGMFAAYVYVHYKDNIARWGSLFTQLLAVLIFLLFMQNFDLEFKPTLAYVIAPVILGFITAFGMVVFLLNEKTILSKVATSWPFLFIAKISFSIYIWHTVIMGKVSYLLISNQAKLAINCVGTLVVSICTYYLIEQPFLKIKQKKIIPFSSVKVV